MTLTYSTDFYTWTIPADTQAYNILDNEIQVRDTSVCWIHQQFIDQDDNLYAELLGSPEAPEFIYFYDANQPNIPQLLNSLPATTTAIAFA